MKRGTVLCSLIGIAIAGIAIAVSFHFDDSVREFMMQHQNPAMRNFMRYVSLFGDWPLHAAVGLVLLGLAWPGQRRVDADFRRHVVSHDAGGCGGAP